MRVRVLELAVAAEVAEQYAAFVAGIADNVYDAATWLEHVANLAEWEHREGFTSEWIACSVLDHPRASRLARSLAAVWFTAARALPDCVFVARGPVVAR